MEQARQEREAGYAAAMKQAKSFKQTAPQGVDSVTLQATVRPIHWPCTARAPRLVAETSYRPTLCAVAPPSLRAMVFL